MRKFEIERCHHWFISDRYVVQYVIIICIPKKLFRIYLLGFILYDVWGEKEKKKKKRQRTRKKFPYFARVTSNKFYYIAKRILGSNFFFFFRKFLKNFNRENWNFFPRNVYSCIVVTCFPREWMVTFLNSYWNSYYMNRY